MIDLPALPAALQWDHNAHYHPWVLRQLPDRPARVLDVGCGRGGLACVLAERTPWVDAVDLSPAMIAAARGRCPTPRVHWIEGDVLDDGLPLARAGYDAITSVASLHHLALRPALTRFRALLRPGGVLAVVSLARPRSVADVAWALAATPANAAVGVALALRGEAGKPDDAGMPIRDPTESLQEIRSVAADVLPGVRIRRALFWRYLLRWTAP